MKYKIGDIVKVICEYKATDKDLKYTKHAVDFVGKIIRISEELVGYNYILDTDTNDVLYHEKELKKATKKEAEKYLMNGVIEAI